MNEADLWYKIELEAYCVRGTIGCNLVSDSTKAIVLDATAKRLRELAIEVEKQAEILRRNSESAT